MTNQAAHDVVVLGAGIIGVSVALHLQQRGRKVALVDRGAPGHGTSFGNAGLIERSGVVPYGFPRDLRMLLQYGLGLNPAVRLDWRFLPRAAPWLWRFWRASSPRALQRAAADLLPLIERSVAEHECLLQAAGASGILRRQGWIELHRGVAGFVVQVEQAPRLRALGLEFDLLGPDAVHLAQPGLLGRFAGAVYWRDPATLADPAAMVQAYADLFRRRGGSVLGGDAASLVEERVGWHFQADGAAHHAREAVVALGPWSDAVCARLGYRFPLLAKRGYHMHYAAPPDTVLRVPVVDADHGYVLSPMVRGIRLTTGVEFAARDAVATPRQLNAAERKAAGLFPIGERRDAAPWMGARPCLPDMRPVIGRAGRHAGLWFAFGHNHHGLTLGPATGRLLAEIMTCESPFADPAPFSPARFDRRGAW